MTINPAKNHLKNIKDGFYQLLAPKGRFCLPCGKRISVVVPHYPELCQACFERIHWIKEPRCLICGRHVGCPDCTRRDDAYKQAVHRHFKLHRSSVAYSEEMSEWLGSYKFRGDERYAPLLAKMLVQGAKTMQQQLTSKLLTNEPLTNELLADEPTKKGSMFYQYNQCRQYNQCNQLKQTSQPYNIFKLFKNKAFNWDVVTYVPISAERMKERGFNQSFPLAEAVAKKHGLPLYPLLERTMDTDKQSHKNRYQRLQSIASLYQPAPHSRAYIQQTYHTNKFTNSHQTDQCLNILLIDDVYTTGSTLNACSLALKQLGKDMQIPFEVYGLTWARS
ncbi:hypothetical protein ABE099_14895 [Paenibacillus turicensis]|uniref:ComF family protein n=1 Tax=Paenibacillus turicensis TaxID=160487 RepID=UPI003D26BD66